MSAATAVSSPEHTPGGPVLCFQIASPRQPHRSCRALDQLESGPGLKRWPTEPRGAAVSLCPMEHCKTRTTVCLSAFWVLLLAVMPSSAAEVSKETPGSRVLHRVGTHPYP